MPGEMQIRPPAQHFSATELAFLYTVANDTKEQPWMVINDVQFTTAAQLVLSLRHYLAQQGSPWSVGGMLPLSYLSLAMHTSCRTV